MEAPELGKLPDGAAGMGSEAAVAGIRFCTGFRAGFAFFCWTSTGGKVCAGDCAAAGEAHSPAATVHPSTATMYFDIKNYPSSTLYCDTRWACPVCASRMTRLPARRCLGGRAWGGGKDGPPARPHGFGEKGGRRTLPAEAAELVRR